MSKPEKQTTIQIAEALMEPIAEKLGLEIWDIEFKKEGNQWYLRYFLEKEGGININDCEAASREISDILDKHDPIPQNYILEVGSPGIDRLLKKDDHFQQYIGEMVEVKLIRPLEGIRSFVGKLVSKNGQDIVIETEDDLEMTFQQKEAAYVRLHIDFNIGG